MKEIAAHTAQEPPVLIDSKEAARLLGCCERTLWKMREEGKIRCVKLGAAVRFARKEIDRFIDSQSTQLKTSPAGA
ncbi:helix-turn-helix domain-containing protein [Gimesia maris]|uniref:helix-turn-helix domain-containing protein n=1 Tax=Gimesia maris TaxID=122 RepID=UPI003A9060DD